MATPAEWTAQSRSASVEEHWLVQLYYGDETNFLGISDIDVIVTQQYYGIVQDFGEIEKEIDLKECTASVGSVTIVCNNVMKNGTLSELLFGVATPATTGYLNRKVLIYSTFGSTTLTDCLLLGRFILTDITHNLEEVILTLEEWHPWYGVTLPREKVVPYGKYFPLVFGAFTPEASNNSTPALCHSAKCWPAPVYKINGYSLGALAFCGASEANPHVHHYEPSIERETGYVGIYVPLQTAGGSNDFDFAALTSSPDNTGDGIITVSTLFRCFQYWATSEDAGEDDFVGSTAARTSDDTEDASWELTKTEGQNDLSYNILELELPNIQGSFDDFDIGFEIAVKIYCDLTLLNRPSVDMEIFDISYDSSATPRIADASSIGMFDLAANSAGGDWCTNDSFYSCTASIVYDPVASYYYNTISTEDAYTEDEFTFIRNGFYKRVDTDGDLIDGAYPTKLKLCVYHAVSAVGAGGTYKAGVRVRSYWVKKATVKIRDENENIPGAQSSVMQDIDYVYLGVNGPVNTWASTNIEECHEMHREILQGYLGMATADIDTAAWTTLGYARSTWNARLWELEPTPVIDILEELQLNGGFVTYWKGNTLTYDWIKNSYVNSDFPLTDGDPVVAVLDEKDYINMDIGLTPYSELVTRRIYRYDRDPGSDKLLESYERESGGTGTYRTNYLINDGENVEDVDLRYLVAAVSGGSNPNDSLALYYDNILGKYRVIVTCDIVSPDKWDLDFGDIIQFNDSNIVPFGKSWGDLYFKIVDYRRSVNNLYIKAREVYSA